ncbi:MAG: GNAT family N-acetyltransferase [Pseudomonadota bacterium]
MDALFRNHLHFLRRHRGDFLATRDGVYMVGEAPGVSFWTPLHDAARLPEDFGAVRLLPQSGEGWPARLGAAGYVEAETFSYQALACGRALSPRFPVPEVPVRRVESREDALAFARVQSAAFLTGDDGISVWWRSFFALAAVRNYQDPGQDMLIADAGDGASAAVLVVHAAGVSGLYAVATRPEARGKGLGTALLASALGEAARRGSQALTLHTESGSFADGYYRRLGFEERYASPVWRRPAG